jgi:hypothetical protein
MIEIGAVWLRKIGHDVQVLVEVEGRWRLVISEPEDGNYSHIVEAAGIAAELPQEN